MVMSEKRLTRDESAIKTNEVIDTVRDNALRIVDEVAKNQPQFAQSISNLQLDYIQTVKSMIETGFANQKQVVSTLGTTTPKVAQIPEPITRQSTELTNNAIRSAGILHQLSVNALDAARENVKIYNRTVDAVADFSNNILKTWASYWSVQQQQQPFYRA
jgi:hypothetical protein